MKDKLNTLIKKGKWLRSLLLTIILIAIIVAIYVGINIILKKANITDIDLTQEKLYSLSQESIDKIANVKQKTNIIIFGMDSYPEVELYANLYTKQNENITYEVINDASTRPDLVLEYGLGSSSTSLVIIETETRDKLLGPSDLYTYDNTTYAEINITEQALTNAILDVNLETNPKVYFVTNHAQYDGYYTIAIEYLKNEANNVETLDLLVKGGIPEDCDVLVITTLKEDFTDFETEKILGYINNGGNLMILSDPNYTQVDLTNFEKILSQYGVSISTGEVYETDDAYMISVYPDIILPETSYDSEITKYIAVGGTVTFMGSGIINYLPEQDLEELGVEIQNLVYATSTSFLRNDYTITTAGRTSSDSDAAGAILGASITKKIASESGEDKKSKLVLYANSVFASDLVVSLDASSSSTSNQIVGILLYNNKDLLINSVSYLTNRTDNLTIRKDMGTIYTFTATEKERKIITGIIVGLPILIVIIGIVVWQVRRRRK